MATMVAGPEDASPWASQIDRAIELFELGVYADSKAMSEAVSQSAAAAQPAASESSEEAEGEAGRGDQGSWPTDAWRLTLDNLATAHEDVGDPERAEALYLRMLAWREGAEQFRQGHFSVSQQLFRRSPEYTTVEDATWFLSSLRPDDGHSVSQAVSLLALGEEVAAKAAVAVWTLALRADHRPKITECGGLELLAKAVAYHVDSPELQAAGCGALRLLCQGHRLAAENREKVIKLGGVEALLSSLRFHHSDTEVQREACGALRVLSHHPLGACRALEGSATALCLRTIAESRDEAVCDAACGALGALGRAGALTSKHRKPEEICAAEARLRHEREQGLRLCEAALVRSLGEPQGPPCRAVPQALLGAVAAFLEDDSLGGRALGLVETSVACMQLFAGYAKVQLAASAVLLRLVSGAASEDAVVRTVRCGALVLLGQAMRDLPTYQEFQRTALGVFLHCTMSNNDFKTVGVKAGGIQATITAMQRYIKDALLQERAIGVLTNLCDTVGRSALCARLGGIEATVRAIKRHTSAGRVAEQGCIMMCMFTDDLQLRQHILTCGIFPLAKQFAKAADRSELQRWGRELLQELADAAHDDD